MKLEDGKEKEKEKNLVQKIKEQLLALMQGVLDESEFGMARFLITKIVEFLILLAFSFHNKVETFI